MSRQGVAVQVRDGEVVYKNGHTVTFTDTGRLLVLDAAGEQLACFEVGNWPNAEVLSNTFARGDRQVSDS
jgi:hypothetical protein